MGFIIRLDESQQVRIFINPKLKTIMIYACIDTSCFILLMLWIYVRLKKMINDNKQ